MNIIDVNEKVSIKWLGHAGIIIYFEDKKIVVDPFQAKNENEKADLLLITHEHYDHCSISDVLNFFQNGKTRIFLPASCIGKLKHAGVPLHDDMAYQVWPDFKQVVEGITVEAVPSYNKDKEFHPKDKKWVGYIISAGGVRIYHAGDSDFVEEMKDIRCDVALLPVGGTYTMDAAEAAKACELIKPKLFATPIHYNSVVGTVESADEFEKLASCEVRRFDKQ
ncbi:MBL fold metallo-hydrolase [Candidatus Woesearchaeota archaeon]|nr:MBL fold metallo-hydrolase [Candidatus Woesearchaeota archaeon]